MKFKGMACLLLVVLLLASCSRASDSSIPIGEQELPDMVLRNSSYTLARDADEPMVMQATTITIYKTEKDTVLEQVSFRQGTELSGSCDSAYVAHDNSKATLDGNVIVRKLDGEDEIVITAQSLTWEKTGNSMSCDGEVSVVYSDGTSIQAIGFSALLDENKFEFSQILEGTLSE